MDSIRTITQTSAFSRKIDQFISERKVLERDFEALKKSLVKYPDQGDLIIGTGGCRKIRLKSATKGKSGGFRVIYFDDPKRESCF